MTMRRNEETRMLALTVACLAGTVADIARTAACMPCSPDTIASMRAGRHDPIPVPGVTCIDCGDVLKESAAADGLRCAKCRRRRKDWLLRLSEWLRSRPAPMPGHCPVCGIKKKAGKPYCSDPCANEAAHWEAVAAWLDGRGPDPTKPDNTKQEGAR